MLLHSRDSEQTVAVTVKPFYQTSCSFPYITDAVDVEIEKVPAVESQVVRLDALLLSRRSTQISMLK